MRVTKKDLFPIVKLMGQNGFSKMGNTPVMEVINRFVALTGFTGIVESKTLTKDGAYRQLLEVGKKNDVFQQLAHEFHVDEETIRKKICSEYCLYILLKEDNQ